LSNLQAQIDEFYSATHQYALAAFFYCAAIFIKRQDKKLFFLNKIEEVKGILSEKYEKMLAI